VNPMTDDVELPYDCDVNGKATKLESFVSCDVLIVDVANEYVEPLAPTPRKPDDRLGSVSVPMVARVDDAYVNDPNVVDELENVWRAVNVLLVYVLGIVVEPLMNEFVVLFANVVSRVTLPAEYVSPDEKVVVATHVGTPPTSASTCPFVPADVVEIAPLPLPNSSVFDWMLDQPVPPDVTASACESVSAPVLENVDVAVPPKYAVYADNCVVDALPFSSSSDVVALCPAAG